MAAIRIAQYGTGHGHAGGKMLAMRKNPDVEVAGLFEPDAEQRARFEKNDAYVGVRWYESAAEMLGDASITAIAIEGRNDESLGMAQESIAAKKHLWYDKPAGDDWAGYQALIASTRTNERHIQMGYMLRYHEGFKRAATWARDGLLGDVFSLRAHMSTFIPVTSESGLNVRSQVTRHRGGIFYDLAGHMLDQVVWILGRPTKITTFFRNDTTPELPGFADNTLGVFEFDKALATVDIAAMETRPMARRFEIYGTRGSVILLEPFEPGEEIRLCLDTAREGFEAGQQIIRIPKQDRQELYVRELASFVGFLRGEMAPTRTLEHEFLVQETLLRATGAAPGG